MIEKLIEFSARNKYTVVLFTAIAVIGAVFCMKRIPLDAIPDLSDTQVIIYSRWDRSPDIIEDQVTYPVLTAMLGAPNVKAVRGFSDFGFSYVYVIFQDGTDLYWARSRVLEYLSKIQSRLPEGVRTELGPDATGVGWVYQYSLVDKTGQHDLAELRSFQDWTLRYWLQSVPGVAEVASIGGFQKQYQINIDPRALAAYHVPLTKVIEAVHDNNNDVGARLVEFSGTEYMVRGRGYAKSIGDLENMVVGRSNSGTPVLVKHVAKVILGPELRRGVVDLDGLGDTVGGIVIMRQGENALNVIARVKERIQEITPSLPPGMEIIPVYDRSELIKSSIHTLKHELVLEIIIVSLVILFFLWHIPSAIVPILTIPIAVVLAFIPMYALGLTSNIMSLAGIAISIGILVDGAIVEVENAYKRLEEWNEAGRPGDFHAVRLQALKEVGPSVFFSLLVIAVTWIGDQVPSTTDLYACRSRGPAVQAPGLLEKFRDGDRRASGGHAGSRDPHDVHAHGSCAFQTGMAVHALEPHHRREILPGRTTSGQPASFQSLRTGLPSRAETSEAHADFNVACGPERRSSFYETGVRVYAAAR